MNNCEFQTKQGPWRIDPDDLARWYAKYGRTFVRDQIDAAQEWLDANPSRRKTHRGMKRFLVNWFNSNANTRRRDRRDKADAVSDFGEGDGFKDLAGTRSKAKLKHATQHATRLTRMEELIAAGYSQFEAWQRAKDENP